VGRGVGRYTPLSCGRKAPISIANLMDASFETPSYHPASDFPTANMGPKPPPGGSVEPGLTEDGTGLPDEATSALPASSRADVPGGTRGGLPVEAVRSSPDQANAESRSNDGREARTGEDGELPSEAWRGLPNEAGCGLPDSALNAHFMSLCAKLMYEEPAVICDVVTNRWGPFTDLK
jgi:hypothetical protein